MPRRAENDHRRICLSYPQSRQRPTAVVQKGPGLCRVRGNHRRGERASRCEFSATWSWAITGILSSGRDGPRANRFRNSFAGCPSRTPRIGMPITEPAEWGTYTKGGSSVSVAADGHLLQPAAVRRAESATGGHHASRRRLAVGQPVSPHVCSSGRAAVALRPAGGDWPGLSYTRELTAIGSRTGGNSPLRKMAASRLAASAGRLK